MSSFKIILCYVSLTCQSKFRSQTYNASLKLSIIKLLGHCKHVHVKAVTLIFIAGRGSAISSAQGGKSRSILLSRKLSCLSRANMCAFHENRDSIYTELTLINP